MSIDSFLRVQTHPMPRASAGGVVTPLFIEVTTSPELLPCLVSRTDGSCLWVNKVSKEGFLRAGTFEPPKDEVMVLRPMLRAVWENGVELEAPNVIQEPPSRKTVRKGIRYLKNMGYDEVQYIGVAPEDGLPPGLRHGEADFVHEGEAVLMPEPAMVGVYTRIGRKAATICYDPVTAIVILSGLKSPFESLAFPTGEDEAQEPEE